MATFMAFFVNTAGKPVEETFSGIREIIGKSKKDKEIEGFVTANYRDPHPWVQVEMFDEFLVPMARRISGRLQTDVIYLGFQTAVDSFLFTRFSNGREIRSLIYGYEEEGVWETVRGKPEEWEEDLIFDEGEVPEEITEDDGSWPGVNTNSVVTNLGDRLDLPGFSGNFSVNKREEYWTITEVMRKMSARERMKIYGLTGLFMRVDYGEKK